MRDNVKIALGVPAYGGQVASQHAAMWFSLGRAIERSSFATTMLMVDCNGVQRARNTLVAHAMAQNCDWLLMIDADTWVEGDDPGQAIVEMLIAGFDVNGAAIVAAPVMRRGADGLAVYRWDGDGKYVRIADLNFDPTKARPIDGLVEVDAVGAAIMAIDLHQISDAHFAFTDAMSEDLEFCRQIKSVGGTILVDKRVRTAHRGNAPVMRY